MNTAKEASGLDPDYRRFSILFVEDEDITRHYFCRICEPHFNVVTAGNVPEALALLETRHQEFAILLTDQRMPGPRGGELLVTARQKYPEIVRMLTTAYMDLDEAIQSVNEGEIFRYLEKPWDIEKLKSALFDGMHLFMAREKQQSLMAHRQKGLFGLSSKLAEQIRVPAQRIHRASTQLAAPHNQKVFSGKQKPLKAQYAMISESLEQIVNESQNLIKFVDMMMLDFSNSSENETAESQPLSMLECVNEAIVDAPRELNRDVSIKLGQTDDFTFSGIRPLVVHMLVNLIKRALIATRDNQRGPGVIEIVVSAGEDVNLLLVRDNGENTDLDDPSVVLDELKNNQRSEDLEHGINLGFCIRTIEKMQGRIECQHDRGRSTQFTVILTQVDDSKNDNKITLNSENV
ncbi:MAG: response regulator [Pseudomonadota bacterium]